MKALPSLKIYLKKPMWENLSWLNFIRCSYEFFILNLRYHHPKQTQSNACYVLVLRKYNMMVNITFNSIDKQLYLIHVSNELYSVKWKQETRHCRCIIQLTLVYSNCISKNSQKYSSQRKAFKYWWISKLSQRH